MCVLSACIDCNYFNSHQMSVPVGWVSSKVNKFEQVSSGGHQMSLVGQGSGLGATEVGPQVSCWGGGLYNEVQCIMGNGHMLPPLLPLTE